MGTQGNVHDNNATGTHVAIVQKPTLSLLKERTLGTTPVAIYGFYDRLPFAQMFRALPGFEGDLPLEEIERLLKERKHTFSPEQRDEMLRKQARFFLRQEDGEDFGLYRNDRANLVPVHYPDGIVWISDAYWEPGDDWSWRGYRLSYGGLGCREGCLVISNSDTANS